VLGVALLLTPAAVGAMAAVAAEIGVQRAAAGEADGVGRHARGDAHRLRRGASECRRQRLDVADDLPDLVGGKQIAEVWHRAGL